jgi:hypothetical protein
MSAHAGCFYKGILVISIAVLLWANVGGATSYWHCPGNGNCITFPEFWKVRDAWDKERLLTRWDLQCRSICSFGYGVASNMEQCSTLENFRSYHIQPIPTLLSSCDLDSNQFVCQEDFFFSEITNSCIQCVSFFDSKCPIGYYFERCQRNEQSLECKACENPNLNTTSQMYDVFYKNQPSCTNLTAGQHLQFSDAEDGAPSCAPYLTPWWDEYKCPIRCQVNYINIGANGAANCVPCHTECNPGWQCGGEDDTQCYHCVEELGPHQEWLPNTNVNDGPCRVGCKQGFYDTEPSENVVDCLQCPLQTCINGSHIFLGCGGNSFGRCQPPNVQCREGETYLYYEYFSEQAECKQCSVPSGLGGEYIAAACDAQRDAILKSCTNACPDRFFKTQNCSLDRDIQCQRCTNPLEKQGKLLAAERCGGESDYVFLPCPDGFACDGTTVPKRCPPPKHSENGLCVCPQNTFSRGELCITLQCASGFYPQAETGDCVPCSRESQHAAITLDGMLGREACACREGYFIQRWDVSPDDSVIRCWPCGNLTCLQGIEAQTPCPGVWTEEPTCTCVLPSGVKAFSNPWQNGDCRIASCEAGLEETPTFTALAAAQPRVWETSLWSPRLQPFSEDSVVLANDYQEVNSVAVIGEGVIVYIVNHVSLMLAVRHNGTSHWRIMQIDNGLFIKGFRESEPHVLVDMSVCRDKTDGRFWLSFVMLTSYCGENGNVNGKVGTCSNFELIEVRDEGGDEACVSIGGGTGMCAENMFLIWTKTISEGIPSLQIFSMALNYISQTDEHKLYLAMGDENTFSAHKVYTYSIKYYEKDVPYDERDDDVIIPMAGAGNGIRCLLWIENRLMALHEEGRLTLLAGDSNSAIQRIMAYFDGKRLSWIAQGGAAGLLVALTTGADAVTYEADIWNGWVLKKPSSPRTSYVFLLFNAWISIQMVGNSSVATWTSEYTPCPVDHVHILHISQVKCVLQPCLLLRGACGQNSVRKMGETLCTCLPGYVSYPGSNECSICPANHYCASASGHGSPIVPCPSNTNSVEGSSSASQCLCSRGYYAFDTFCLPCPIGFWCYGQNSPPMKCNSGSSTGYMGAASPLLCGCNPRTHGIDCRPCPVTHRCSGLSNLNQRPKISAIYLSGSGSMEAEATLNTSCLTWGVSIVYHLPSLFTSKKRGKMWHWMVVTELLPGESDESGLVKNISTCMVAHNFSLEESMMPFVYTKATTAINVQRATPCSLHYEWSGDYDQQNCVCVAGYEEMKGAALFTFCSPCKNGTFRADKITPKCIKCKDNNTHAPWMGMDHCICIEGHFKNHLTGDCVPIPVRFASYDLISSPFLVIPLSLVAIILCFLGVWIASFMT